MGKNSVAAAIFYLIALAVVLVLSHFIKGPTVYLTNYRSAEDFAGFTGAGFAVGLGLSNPRRSNLIAPVVYGAIAFAVAVTYQHFFGDHRLVEAHSRAAEVAGYLAVGFFIGLNCRSA